MKLWNKYHPPSQHFPWFIQSSLHATWRCWGDVAVGPAHTGFAVSDKSSSPCNFPEGPWAMAYIRRQLEGVWKDLEFSWVFRWPTYRFKLHSSFILKRDLFNFIPCTLQFWVHVDLCPYWSVPEDVNHLRGVYFSLLVRLPHRTRLEIWKSHNSVDSNTAMQL